MDASPDKETQNTSEEVDNTRVKDEMSEIRRLLLNPERTQLKNLQERLDNPKLHARDISQILPEAILLRSKRDQRIAKVLTPVLEDAVKTSVKKNPKILVDAIFPVMGPAIRKAIFSTTFYIFLISSCCNSLFKAFCFSFSFCSIYPLNFSRTSFGYGSLHKGHVEECTSHSFKHSVCVG